jgi:hypothetical protein
LVDDDLNKQGFKNLEENNTFLFRVKGVVGDSFLYKKKHSDKCYHETYKELAFE